ncbi:MAG: flagellar assembly protein FliH [Gammaproteobacteria bacterium]|nr:flagellar assembly protein FliH [Gammaproteobacteria bacterium]
MHKTKDSNLLSDKEKSGFNIWSPPEVIGQTINADQIDARKTVSASSTGAGPVTAQSLEEIRKAAYLEGLEKGKSEGKEQVLVKQKQITNQLKGILQSCHQQASIFDQEICEQLVAITVSVAKQVIRRELNTDPEQIMAVIREAISCLPASSEKLLLKLHPDDAALVREIYHLDEEPDRTWKIFEDPGLQRGGCIINSESSLVNADLDARIATIVSQLLGGERSDD